MEFDRTSSDQDSSMKIGFDQHSQSTYSKTTRGMSDTSRDQDSEYILIEKELAEEKKPPKPVARILPAFIDLLIMGAQLCIFGGFLYMSYIYGKLKQTQCTADSQSQLPITHGDTIGSDVTQRFAIAIRWGFWMSTLNILRAILAQVALKIKNWMLLYGSYVMFACNFTIIIIMFIFMNIWRWDNPGRVCSGDYLKKEDKENPNISSSYLITEGKFLKIVLIIVYCILGLGCYSVCFIAFFLSQKKTKEQLQKGESMFKTKTEPVYEIQIKNATDSRADRTFSADGSNQNLLKQ